MSDNNQAIEWYLARDGQQHGPINEVELQKVIELGYLRPTDLVWRPGMADWAPASTILPKTAPFGGSEPKPATASAAEARRAEAPSAQHGARPGGETAPAPVSPDARYAEAVARGPHPQSSHAEHPHQQPIASGAGAGSGVEPHGAPRGHAPGGGLPAPQPVGLQRGQPHPNPHHYGQHANPAASGYAQHAHPQWEPRQQRVDGPTGSPHPASGHQAGGGGHPQPAVTLGGAHPQAYPQPGRPSSQPAPRLTPAGFEEPEEVQQGRGFPWRLVAMFVVLVGLAGGGFALYKSGQLSALPFLSAPEKTGALPVVTAPSGAVKEPGKAAAPAAPTGASGGIDQTLQRSPLWQRLKRDYPDWYRERLDEAGRLSGNSADDREISAAMTRAVVELRRKHHTEALSAAPARLKSIATSFVENLGRLSRYSTAACYGFISQGEMSPAVVEIRATDLRGAIDGQLLLIFEAAAEGRNSPQRYDPPRREDYDVLTAELAKKGWTAVDLQLFSDARALARAAPEKVCQMVQDWFAAQLAVKDDAAQLRLLGEALKPVVAG